MKNWFMTFVSDLKFLGREFRKEFLSPSVLKVDKNAPRGFDSSNDLVRPAEMKSSDTILSFRR